jgi:hypothetical protein
VLEASVSNGAGFLAAKQGIEVEPVVAEAIVYSLLLVLVDFSKHPANFLSREPASPLQCITLTA